MTTKTKEAAQTAGVDLTEFEGAVERQNEGIDIHILGMDGKTPLGFSIRVAGPDSKVAEEAQADMADELLEEGNLTRLQARQAAEQGIKYLTKITLGWSQPIKFDGQEHDFTPANAEKLYRRFKFIREQVDKAAGKRAAFLKK